LKDQDETLAFALYALESGDSIFVNPFTGFTESIFNPMRLEGVEELPPHIRPSRKEMPVFMRNLGSIQPDLGWYSSYLPGVDKFEKELSDLASYSTVFPYYIGVSFPDRSEVWKIEGKTKFRKVKSEKY